MIPPPRILRMALSSMLCGVFTALAGPGAHPNLADRLVEVREGLRIEYSPGDEPYVEETFKALRSWREERQSLVRQFEERAKQPLPLSPADLRRNREEILTQIAREIGLKAPTAFQGETFDALLDYYEKDAFRASEHAAFCLATSNPSTAQIWRGWELARRLDSGEQIPGIKYEEIQGRKCISFIQELRSGPTPELELAKLDFERRKLDNPVNYRKGADGVVTICIALNTGAEARGRPLAPPSHDNIWKGGAEKANVMCGDTPCPPLIVPIPARENQVTPATLPGERIALVRALLGRGIRNQPYRRLSQVLMIFHEVAEAGLVENIIGSADRRWFCDGAATHVAWKVIRDRAGADVAQKAYDLDAQLDRFREFQPMIALSQWPAAENMTAVDRDQPLNKARYAFATRAFAMLGWWKGEEALPKILQEVARTPRHKVTMSTVGKAYRKVTGSKLEEIVVAAETTPIAKRVFATPQVPLSGEEVEE